MATKRAIPAPEEPEEPRQLPDVAWLNQFLVGAGENLPNHVLTQMGRGKFVSIMDPQSNARMIFRTKQEVYRLVAWLLCVTDAHALPDEAPTHPKTGMILADEPYTYEEIEAHVNG